MAITRAKKEAVLTKLSEIKDNAEAIVFVNFNTLGAQNTTTMRAKLREAGVDFVVAKKTLIKRAFDGAFTGDMPALDGEIALAYSTDAITPAQEIKGFSKEFKDSVTIVGGVFQGVYKDQEEMTEIASIPGLDVLRGMFVNVINSPIQGLVLGLNAIAEKKA